MNCPICGAQNEPGSRFCLECGAPLADQFDDDDQTILSTASPVAEEAKTVSVSYDEVETAAQAEPEAESAPPVMETEPTPPSMPPAGPPADGSTSRRNIIIGVVVLLLLLCCCLALAIGGVIAFGEELGLEMELSLQALTVLAA